MEGEKQNGFLAVVCDIDLLSLRLFQGAATAREESAAIRKKEDIDRVSVPDGQYQSGRGIHPSKGRRHTGRPRIGNALSG